MFCTKCGNECSNYALFCDRCGEKLASVNTPIQNQSVESPLSITEYFENECSDTAAKRQLVLKKLLRASGIIHLALLLMSLLFNIKLLVVPMFLFYFLIRLLPGGAFAICSLILSQNGIQKKSPGCLFASVPLAFLSTCISTSIAINIPVLNIVIVAIVVTLHIGMIIINNKNVKEYKEYLHK